MAAYYNEHDRFAAAWLRELIKAGLIADGEVDERSVADVQPGDVKGFGQCHWFAGIGGWSYALRLAGWPDDRPIWTGSCPCQSYSSAGKRQGADDARNLWPTWFRIIRECRPVRIVGEQVADAIGHGWLDHVSTELEAEDYSIGAVVLGAHSVGAPHRRQRLYWLADAEGDGLEEQRLPEERRQVVADVTRGGRLREDACVADAESEREREQTNIADAFTEVWKARLVARCDGESVADADSEQAFWSSIARSERNPWSVEPAVGRVAHGLSHKLVEPFLRGYGNAIVPQVGAAFIQAYCEARGL